MSTFTPIPMRYEPVKDVEVFEVGDWKWVYSYSAPTGEAEEMRLGFIYMNPMGTLAVCLERIPRNVNQGKATWVITGDESTGLTVEPSVMSKRGTPEEWHGRITAGQMITLED